MDQSKLKMTKPEYHFINSNKMSVYKDEEKKIKVIAGQFQEAEGAIKDHNVEPVYFDVELQKNKEFIFPIINRILHPIPPPIKTSVNSFIIFILLDNINLLSRLLSHQFVQFHLNILQKEH